MVRRRSTGCDLRSFGLEGALDVRPFEALETFYPQKRMGIGPDHASSA